MNKITTFIVLAAVATGLGFTACNDDDPVKFQDVEVKNTELKAILVKQGYTFNQAGQLVLDDKAQNTTTLDLSETKISDLSGLDVLPNLTEVDLSDNDYGPVFDFSSLPAQITAIDLTGNKIFDFKGLVDAKVENDEVKATILSPLTKLYLPESAKWNVEDLMPFYTENKANGIQVDMQMQDASGNLQVYTTLREIPDPYFRTYLKTLFPSLFPNDGTQIDISKPMALVEQGSNINLWYTNQFADIARIESIEGVEYFVNNPFYRPFIVSIGYAFENPLTVSYLAPGQNIKGLLLTTVSTPDGVNLSRATGLASFIMGDNGYLTELDLSNTLVFNQELSDIETSTGNGLELTHCQNLKTIRFPEEAEGIVWTLKLGDLPVLEELDLSFVHAAQGLYLMQLPKCSITYPDLKYRFNAGKKQLEDLSIDARVEFAITQDVFNMASTKAFITKYRFPDPNDPDQKPENDIFFLNDKYRTYQKEFDAIRWSQLIKQS